MDDYMKVSTLRLCLPDDDWQLLRVLDKRLVNIAFSWALHMVYDLNDYVGVWRVEDD